MVQILSRDKQRSNLLGFHPSILLFFPLGFKQVFPSDTLPCTLPNALSSHQHHKPPGYIVSGMFCLQHLLFLSILSHSFKTLRYVPAEKEWRGHSSRRYFTPTGNVNKASLGPAVGKKKLHSGGGMLHLQDHSASEPEQTTDNRKLFFQRAS